MKTFVLSLQNMVTCFRTWNYKFVKSHFAWQRITSVTHRDLKFIATMPRACAVTVKYGVPVWNTYGVSLVL